MEELYPAQVDYDEAKKYGDYMLILQDLGYTIECSKRLRQLLKDNCKDTVLVQGLWIGAVVSYCRCFRGGVRTKLKEDIFKDLKEGDPVTCHKQLLNIRNMHIAHSVSPLGQVSVGLILSAPEKKKREILGIGFLIQKQIHLDIQGVENLLNLAQVAKKEAERLGKKYYDKTLEIGRTLPIDDLYKRARVRTTTPGLSAMGKARKR